MGSGNVTNRINKLTYRPGLITAIVVGLVGLLLLNIIKIMKTITHYKAQSIASNLAYYIPKDSPLKEFGITGRVVEELAVTYHAHLDEMLNKEYQFLKKELESLQQLKNYFREYSPLPIGVARDPANIKTLQFDNVMYAGESTMFRVTWNELGIILHQPGKPENIFSISLTDAKELARVILNQ